MATVAVAVVAVAVVAVAVSMMVVMLIVTVVGDASEDGKGDDDRAAEDALCSTVQAAHGSE